MLEQQVTHEHEIDWTGTRQLPKLKQRDSKTSTCIEKFTLLKAIESPVSCYKRPLYVRLCKKCLLP